MMINPGSSDLAGVFALLAAVSDPKTAKANLKEISDASTAYQKSIDDGRAELKNATDALEAKRAAVQAANDKALTIKNDIEINLDIREKQLKDQDVFLAKREANVRDAEAALLVRETDLKAKEKAVASREVSVSDREASVEKLDAKATTIFDEYSARLTNLQDMVIGPVKIVMPADTGLVGQTMGS